mmetsp:Transcript_2292/g.4793  ORF Transcript_2292/g.4793 Transcript_2292/m.4793 type:complete len:354 (+) Transcript_2292:518-1579(+)
MYMSARRLFWTRLASPSESAVLSPPATAAAVSDAMPCVSVAHVRRSRHACSGSICSPFHTPGSVPTSVKSSSSCSIRLASLLRTLNSLDFRNTAAGPERPLAAAPLSPPQSPSPSPLVRDALASPPFMRLLFAARIGRRRCRSIRARAALCSTRASLISILARRSRRSRRVASAHRNAHCTRTAAACARALASARTRSHACTAICTRRAALPCTLSSSARSLPCLSSSISRSVRSVSLYCSPTAGPSASIEMPCQLCASHLTESVPACFSFKSPSCDATGVDAEKRTDSRPPCAGAARNRIEKPRTAPASFVIHCQCNLAASSTTMGSVSAESCATLAASERKQRAIATAYGR